MLALELFKMSLLRSLVRGCLFFYKDAAPTELKQKKHEWLHFNYLCTSVFIRGSRFYVNGYIISTCGLASLLRDCDNIRHEEISAIDDGRSIPHEDINQTRYDYRIGFRFGGGGVQRQARYASDEVVQAVHQDPCGRSGQRG